MNPERDLELVVTDWLRITASASGSDRVLAGALGRLSTVRQERRRLTWMRPPLSPTLRLAGLAAAVVVIAVAGSNVLNVRRDAAGGFPAVPTPVPTSGMDQCPQDPAPQPAGPQAITLFSPIRLTVTLPESSLGGCWEVTNAGHVDPVWWASFAQDLATGLHPGGIGITTADPVPAGCEGFPGWDRAAAAIDGFTGERYDYVGPFEPPFTPCHPNAVVDQLGETSGRGPETLLTLWMLDVNGQPLNLFAWIKSLDYGRQAELRHIIEAVQIEAAPSN